MSVEKIKMDKIIVQTEENTVTVFLEVDPDIQGSGDSLIEAIGMMVFDYPWYFHVTL